MSEINKEVHIQNFYPCPVNDILNINLTYPATVQLVDMLGKGIYSRIFASGYTTVATENLPNGFYLLYKIYTNGQTEIDKILINHP